MGYDKFKIIIGGDFCPRKRIISNIRQGDFEFFNTIKPIVQEADYTVVNLECPITDRNSLRPLSKVGPSLSAPSDSLKILKECGINIVTLANNHILDYGVEGLKDTLVHLNKNGIKYLGAGCDEDEASQVLILEKNNLKIAIINCCEHEFSVASDSSGGANALNPIKQYYSINQVRDKVDKIIMIIHGGHEGYQLPSYRMQETYRFFIDCGADIIINHHQHCFSGWEIYKNKPIFYGLGNLCFDKNENLLTPWNYGFLVELILSKHEDQFLLYPYVQCGAEAKLILLSYDVIQEELNHLNKIISSPKSLKEAQDKYYNSSQLSIRNKFEPFQNRYINKVRKLLKFPYLMRRRDLRILRNHIECESHRDRLLYYLHNKTS